MPSELARYLWAVTALVVVALMLSRLGSVLMPFALGALLAYMCAPLVEWLERRHLPRWLAVVAVMVLVVAVVVGLLLVLVPMIVDQVAAIAHEVPHLLEWYRSTLAPWVQANLGVSLPLDAERMRALVSELLRDSGELARRLLPSITTGGLVLLSVLGALVLLPVLLFYFLLDWDRMLKVVMSFVPPRHAQSVAGAMRDIDQALGAFPRGQLSVMLCLSVFYVLALWSVGLDSALSVGIITGMLNFVPYLGFALGLLLGTLAALLEFHSIAGLIAVWAVFAIGQVVESYVLTPRLVGNQVGLHPLWVLFAVLAGGALLGFLGVLLAVPVAAILVVLVRRARARYLASRLYLG